MGPPIDGLRVLTIRQPWADLIMAGEKDVENRTWPVPSTLRAYCTFCQAVGYDGEPPKHHYIGCSTGHVTQFPFRLGIHAAKAAEPASHPAWTTWLGSVASGLAGDDERGVLLGWVTVTGCHHADDCYVPTPLGPTYCSTWAQADQYHWTLSMPVRLAEPIPMKGCLGLWINELARTG